ncbi:MAG: outer membrane lipoprotein carrier protein LolA [Desulfamplus sp.]|nr:outer membrane lipoprotein carrier protein LolA [Desulfamplus sp.]
MKKYGKITWVVILFCLSLLMPGLLLSDDGTEPKTLSVEDGFVSRTFSEKEEDAIISAIEKRYAGEDFSCAYHQKSTLKALGIAEDAWGRAFFSHPGRMRWEYNEPETHEIITDGIHLWIYRPDEKQVMKGDAGAFFKGGAGGSFLSDISMIRDTYTVFVSENNMDTSAVYLTLVPRDENPDIASIKIRVMKDGYLIRGVTTYNVYGDTTEINFSEIQFRELDDSLFKFTIPEGVDVIPMG